MPEVRGGSLINLGVKCSCDGWWGGGGCGGFRPRGGGQQDSEDMGIGNP